MKFTRKASANWKGTGLDGKGAVSTGSGVLKDTPSSYKARFEDGKGTNPEELIAAAHAACFTMQLSFLLSEKGFVPENLDADARITFEDGNITAIHLDLKGTLKGISQEAFEETARKAKEICPVSKLLKAEITLSATLTA
ncbi:MAG: OsmC family protein [Sinomicrobium sp.]|nr:OsmC family protein [Sinomicrobium sp.]